jgi:hypothetical protein
MRRQSFIGSGIVEGLLFVTIVGEDIQPQRGRQISGLSIAVYRRYEIRQGLVFRKRDP